MTNNNNKNKNTSPSLLFQRGNQKKMKKNEKK